MRQGGKIWLVIGGLFVSLFLMNSQAQAVGVPGDSTPPTTPGTPTDGGTVTNSTSATWSWTAASDSESGISTYQIDIGTTPGGSEIANQVSTSGAISYTQSGLSNGLTYYARVRAVNGASLTGDYSGNSNGILVDTAAPTFSGISDATGSSNVTISWSTNEVATSQVRYGTSSGSYSVTSSLDGALVTSHSVAVTSMTSGTYYYQVLSNDAAGNSGVSGEYSFTIAATATPTPSPTPTPTPTISTPSSSPSATASSSPTVSATPSGRVTTRNTPTPTPTPSSSTSSVPSALASESPVPTMVVTLLAEDIIPLASAKPGAESVSTSPSFISRWGLLLLLTLILLCLLGLLAWLHRRHRIRSNKQPLTD